MNGFPEEYLNLISQAEKIEFEDTLNAKRLYLEAIMILLASAFVDKTQEDKFKQEAEIIYQKYEDLNRQYGTVSSVNGHKVKPGNGSLRSVENYIDNPEKKDGINFGSVVGLSDLKEEIMLKVILPLKNPGLIASYNKKGKSGILMYGPPGCGKSMIAEAMANEIGATFFHVKSSDLKSKWVGDTEKNMAELFVKAKTQQPSIIFIDEFESVGRDRSTVGNSFEKNFVSQLLAEMDGLGTKNNRITVIAATNEPWEIDSALLRSGRLGTKIFVGAPDRTTRLSLLKKELKNRPVDANIDLDELSEMTKGFSGADIVALCDTAADEAIKHYLKENEQRNINLRDLKAAFYKIKPVTKSWFNAATRQIEMKNLKEDYPEIFDARIE